MTRLAALSLLVLTACASTTPAPLPDNMPDRLGILQLHQILQIEPDAATVRLQYGRIVARNAVQEQDAFCVFEINSVRPEAQSVPPGEFSITAISRSIESIAGIPMQPYGWQLRRVSLGGDDSPTHIYFKTTFRLRNTAQSPNIAVRALTCMSNQNAPGNAALMRHLTLAEIRGALGERFALNLERSNIR